MSCSSPKYSASTYILQTDQNENISMKPIEIVYMVNGAVRTMVTSTAQVFADFQSSIKQISPMLSKDEQNDVHGAFTEFHKFLMTNRTFLTKTTIRVKRATTNEAVLAAIDIGTIITLCAQTQILLGRFWPISRIIENKLKEHKTFTLWRDISAGIFGVCSSVLVIASGVGASIGFTTAVKSVLIITGSVGVASLSAAVVAQAAQNATVLQQVIDNLRKIEQVLVNLSENYAKQEGYSEDVSVDDSTKQEFLDLLKEAEREVSKGFEILKKV